MKTRKLIFGATLLVLLFSTIGFVITRKHIETSIIKICDQASDKYDCLPRKALVFQLSDDTTDEKVMSNTIWAIGKMKIESTLPKMELLLAACNKSDYKFVETKRELEKAIAYMKHDRIDLMLFNDLHK